MIIDSHCHLDRLDLKPYDNEFSQFIADVKASEVGHMLCVAINLEDYPDMISKVDQYDMISISVGVHPSEQEGKEPTVDELVTLAKHPKNVAIGETGLDYYWCKGDVEWQRQRFKNHIEVAKQVKKPLIIHTRDASEDTLKIMKEANAGEVGGVIHCFTENWDVAKQALDMNFYISFSGIVTFKNALQIKEVAKKVPSDRFLVETDSPYLAPVPKRGKPNYPQYVKYVVAHVAELRGLSELAAINQSTENFCNLFTHAKLT